MTHSRTGFGNKLVGLLSTAVFAVLWPVAAIAQAAPKADFDIPPQRLEAALQQVAQVQRVQILFNESDVKGLDSSGVKGRLSTFEAVQKLIEGTGLSAVANQNNAIAIRPKSANERGGQAANPTPLAQAQSAERLGAPTEGRRQERKDDVVRGEGIVVTAQKREERLQDVPMSVAVITGQDIEQRGLTGMQDYLRSIPGVNQIDRGVNDNSIVIRGITASPESQNFSSGAEVATYFGETPITGAGGYIVGGIDVRPVDLERIEVLRGPQGTTFGSASLSGVLRLIPKAPDLDGSYGKVSGEYSETRGTGSDNHGLHAIANASMADGTFGLRLVGYRQEESGFYRNVVGFDPATLTIATRFGVDNLVRGFVQDDVGRHKTSGARVGALWRPTTDVRASFTFLVQKIEQEGRPIANFGTYDQANVPASPARSGGRRGEYAESNIELYNAVIDYDVPWATFTVIGSWTKSGVSPLSSTTTAAGLSTQTTYMNVESFTSEARLTSRFAGRYQFLGGAFYEDTKNDNKQFLDFLGVGTSAPNPLPTLGFPASEPLAIVQTDRAVTQRAVFGEFSYEVNEKITSTVGGRYFEYDRSEYRLTEGGFVRVVPFGTGIATDIRLKEQGRTLKANLKYEPTRNAMIYGSFSQGFRLGRPSTGLIPGLCDVNNDGLIDGTNVTIASTQEIASDYLDSYEIGAKLAAFDRRLNIDAAAYHLKWDDIPVLTQPPPGSSCQSSYTANAGEATSDGIELQASFLVAKGLTLKFGAGYTNARLSKDAPLLRAQSGARLPGSPRVNASLGAQYEFLLAGRRAFVRADAFYAGTFYGDLLQTPGLRAGGYTKVDARAGTSFGPVSVELFVKNLTDRDDYTWRAISGGANPFLGFRLRPRTIGLQLAYSFR